jgi:RNA polymerase sigma factor (sigma-70 family)
MTEQNKRITEAISGESKRLLNFIRRRVPNESEAEDILQDVMFDYVEAYRLPEPIEQVGAWLFRVARNRIIDRFRKKKEVPLQETTRDDEDDGSLDDMLPSPDAGPEAVYMRGVLMDELSVAMDELPLEQREVFIAHEFDGRSFKELSQESGVAVNTLMARKRYATLYLRKRLQIIYDEYHA